MWWLLLIPAAFVALPIAVGLVLLYGIAQTVDEDHDPKPLYVWTWTGDDS